MFVWPVKPPTKPLPGGYKFGVYRGDRRHLGVDLDGPAAGGKEGNPVYAAASGKVKYAKNFSSGGMGIWIDHPGGWQTRYYHLQTVLNVKPGQQVYAGQQIGKVGRTGITSSPAHLHFEIRKPGSLEAVDPLPYLKSSGSNLLLLAGAVAIGVYFWRRR